MKGYILTVNSNYIVGLSYPPKSWRIVFPDIQTEPNRIVITETFHLCVESEHGEREHMPFFSFSDCERIKSEILTHHPDYKVNIEERW